MCYKAPCVSGPAAGTMISCVHDDGQPEVSVLRKAMVQSSSVTETSLSSASLPLSPMYYSLCPPDLTSTARDFLCASCQASS